MKRTIRFRLNGRFREIATNQDRMLLWVLRTDFGLTGCKYGCGQGLCGACTVLVDRKAVRSCSFPVGRAEGKEVTTIEGLAVDGDLHPVQRAFVEHDALQCGFCTPGMILQACGLLLENPQPSRTQVIHHMEENLCRCGSYGRILQAVEAASHVLRGTKS